MLNFLLTNFSNFRGVLVGTLNGEPLLRWNTNAAIHPAVWRAAAVPLDGGEPVVLPGQPTSGNVQAFGAFDGAVACGFARPFEFAGGLILRAGEALLMERPMGKAFYLGFTTEDGVFGTASGVGGVHWGWDGQILATNPSGFLNPLAAVNVATPVGYTGFSKRAVSADGRYVAGVGINLNAPTRSQMEVHLMVDLLTDTVRPLAEVLDCAAMSNGLQFCEDGSILCVAQATPALQSLVRVVGWEG